MLKLILPLLFATALFGTGAATAGPGAAPTKTLLAPGMVEGVVETMEELRARGLMRQRSQIDLPQARIQAILEEVAVKRGFEGPDQLAAVISSTMQAFSALMVEEQVRAGAAQYRQQRSEIENDPAIPDDQKKQMLEMLETRRKALEALAFDENADAVRPYRDRIRELLVSK